MNSYVKWIFVVLLICSLTAFVEKDKPTGGLSEGDVAPDFKIESTSEEQPAFKLGNLKGKYVLLSFWASYDAQSRMQNVSLSNALRSSHNVEMVSISFDEYQSIFKETVRKVQRGAADFVCGYRCGENITIVRGNRCD